MDRPILNAFLLTVLSSLLFFFVRLYKARMLFIQRKRMGLVTYTHPMVLFEIHVLTFASGLALCP